MRISDWSSDVCSSDLPDAQAESLTVPEDPPTLQILADGTYKLNGDVVDEAGLATRIQELMSAKPDQMILVNGDAKVPYQFVVQGKIGRASCRERVCQYV